MNAVRSAHTLDWRGSSAFDPALYMGAFEPSKVYAFAKRSAFDREFRASVARDARTVFGDHGFGAFGHAAIGADLDARLALDRDELAALHEIADVMRAASAEPGDPVTRGLDASGPGERSLITVYSAISVILIVFVVLVGVDQTY